jgi:serine protease Do
VRRTAFDEMPMFPPDPERERAETAMRHALAASGGRLGPGRVVVAPRMAMDFGDQMFVISPNGVLGASVSTVGPELARKLKLEMGVLVNDVPEETPAWKGGLRTGDVIVNVGGQTVASLRQLRELILMRAADRMVPLRIVRDKKPQDVSVTW